MKAFSRGTFLLGVLLTMPFCALVFASRADVALKPKVYPLQTCIVTDEKLDKDAHVFVYMGQELKTCCKGCKDDFDADPKKFLKKLEPKAKKAKT